MMLAIESEREDDGRWIAEIVAFPGVMAYGMSRAEAQEKAQALALRVITERRKCGEPISVTLGHSPGWPRR
jgi:predicted RNase H-like HicB family nuclease